MWVKNEHNLINIIFHNNLLIPLTMSEIEILTDDENENSIDIVPIAPITLEPQRVLLYIIQSENINITVIPLISGNMIITHCVVLFYLYQVSVLGIKVVCYLNKPYDCIFNKLIVKIHEDTPLLTLIPPIISNIHSGENCTLDFDLKLTPHLPLKTINVMLDIKTSTAKYHETIYNSVNETKSNLKLLIETNIKTGGYN